VDAILLFSHGSVLCGAEHNLLELARQLRKTTEGIVEVGFLNYTEPTFEHAVSRCVELGATRVIVAPYFLVPGKFVVKDLPEQIESARAAHPKLAILVADVIGFHDAMADAVLAAAEDARSPSSWSATGSTASSSDLQGANAFCRENPKCPLYGAPPCRVHAAVTT
jgi:sirohydrochlorin ferrochelatase